MTVDNPRGTRPEVGGGQENTEGSPPSKLHEVAGTPGHWSLLTIAEFRPVEGGSLNFPLLTNEDQATGGTSGGLGVSYQLVSQRHGHGLLVCCHGVLEFRQAEIEQLHAGLRDQDIGGLQVAVDDSFAVRHVERFGDLDGDAQSFLDRPRAFDCRALDKRHHQVVGANVVEMADTRVVEGGYGAGLALKALRELALGEFNRYCAVEARVARLPDFSHASRAYRRENLIRPESVACRKSHGQIC